MKFTKLKVKALATNDLLCIGEITLCNGNAMYEVTGTKYEDRMRFAKIGDDSAVEGAIYYANNLLTNS